MHYSKGILPCFRYCLFYGYCLSFFLDIRSISKILNEFANIIRLVFDMDTIILMFGFGMVFHFGISLAEEKAFQKREGQFPDRY